MAPTGVRLFPSEAGSDPVELMPSSATKTMGVKASSSGLWQTAGAPARPYVRKKPKRVATEEAPRRPKRRFVLKVAAGRDGSNNPARKKRRRANDVAAGVNNEYDAAGRRRDGVGGESLRVGPGQLEGVDGTTAREVGSTVANARDAPCGSSTAGSRVEGTNDRGGSGGELVGAEDGAAAGQERVGGQGREKQQGKAVEGARRDGGDPPEGEGDRKGDEEYDSDDDFSLEPTRKSRASSSAARTAVATSTAAGVIAGADSSRGEGGGDGRQKQDTVNGPATATKRPEGAAATEGAAAADRKDGGDSTTGRVEEDASAVVAVETDEGDTGLAGAAVPDVVVTANYVGDFLKNRHRMTWRLYLEGGVIEGNDQLFVFDECECLLDPP